MKDKILYWDGKRTPELLKASLNANHLSVTATDTMLGFLAPLTKEAYEHLNAVKNSRSNKRYIILIGSLDKLSYFVEMKTLSQQAQKLINQCWPGPLTIVFKAKQNIPPHLVEENGTIALRYPNHNELNSLLTDYHGLFSTSANISGQMPATTIAHIHPNIMASIDWVIVDHKKTMYPLIPSTIVDASEQGPVKIIRQGAYPQAELERILG